MANNAAIKTESEMLNTLKRIRKSIMGINYQTGKVMSTEEHVIACNKATPELAKISKEDKEGIFLLDPEEKALKEKCWSTYREVEVRIKQLTAESKVPDDFYANGPLHEGHEEERQEILLSISRMGADQKSKKIVSTAITNLGQDKRENPLTGQSQWTEVMSREHPVKQELRDLYYSRVFEVTNQAVQELQRVIESEKASPMDIKQAGLRLDIMQKVFVGKGLADYLAKQDNQETEA
jgi:hypothetical protein